MKERKTQRRKGGAQFASPMSDQRRPNFERRGTLPAAPPPTPAQELFGERRRYPNER